MSSRFYFGGSDDSGSDLENDASLPFPKPLDRSAFLVPDFDATAFLSNLSNRFQTLDDLQAELRDLSQSLTKELVDLVNDNYQDFLSLGSTLRGGDDRVEEIRVGMLGFQRNIAAVKEKIDGRRAELAVLLDQKRAVKQDISIARSLLEIAERMDNLEDQLGISMSPSLNGLPTKGLEILRHTKQEDALSEESEEEQDDIDGLSPVLKYHAEQFLILRFLLNKHQNHPFVSSQQTRLWKIRSTILLYLDTAARQHPGGQKNSEIVCLRDMIQDTKNE